MELALDCLDILMEKHRGRADADPAVIAALRGPGRRLRWSERTKELRDVQKRGSLRASIL
jgi:hypothetical protein